MEYKLGYNSTIPYLICDADYDPFDYYNILLKNIFKKEPFSISEINESGSRDSGKTFKITSFNANAFAIAIDNNQKIACYIFRFKSSDVGEILKTQKQALINLGFVESTNKLNFSPGSDFIQKTYGGRTFLTFRNGSFFMFSGLRKANKDVISLKGIDNINGFDYAIEWREEANEISKDDSQAISAAIRGEKDRLRIGSANPDYQHQYYTEYLGKYLPYDEDKLRRTGEQFKLVKEAHENIIFHYTNWRVNPWLSNKQVSWFLRLEKLDPEKYKSWGIGIPGGFEKNVFSRFLHLIKPGMEFKPEFFDAGIDFGLRHPTTAQITGFRFDGSFKSIAEFYHSNKDMSYWDINRQAKEILDFFISFGNQNRMVQQQGLDVKVDWGGGGIGFCEILNSLKEKKYPYDNWLSFSLSKKEIYKNYDRASFLISAITAGLLYLEPKLTPNLWKSLDSIVYKDESIEPAKEKVEIVALNDDPWDAFMYSVMPHADMIINQVKERNKYLV